MTGPVKAAARDKAINNARSNAEDMASVAGVCLGKAINIEDYGLPDIRMNEPLGPDSKLERGVPSPALLYFY